jgi:hypothetical protein
VQRQRTEIEGYYSPEHPIVIDIAHIPVHHISSQASSFKLLLLPAPLIPLLPFRHRLGLHGQAHSAEWAATGSSHAPSLSHNPHPHPHHRRPRHPGPGAAVATHSLTSSRAIRHLPMPRSLSDRRSSSIWVHRTKDGPCCRTRDSPKARVSAPVIVATAAGK